MTSPQAQATDAAGRHEPVLLQRCLDLLAPAIERAAEDTSRGSAAGPVMIDCTLGMGGHTEAALERFPYLTVVGIDRDPEAITLASARLERFGDRFVAVQATYDAVDRVARDHSVSAEGTVDAVLMDLGVSSLQLDEASRASPTPAPHRSTCVWTRARGPPRRTCWKALTVPSSPASCAPTVRSASLHASPPPSCAVVRPVSRRAAPRTWPSSSVRQYPRRHAAAAGTRPNEPSRRCVSPSTPSSTSWSGPFRGPSTV